MIRHLRLTDLPRQLLPGGLDGEDLAQTRAELVAGSHHLTPLRLVRWALSTSRGQQTLAAVHGARMDALVLLQPRCGPRAWEITHLFADYAAEDELRALLDYSVSYVASRGGERLFLRVREGSPVQEISRRAGFVAAYVEETFSLDHAMATDLSLPPLPMRPPLPADDYALFRLYNAVLPASVRAATGLTFDQWRDSREAVVGFAREYVWESEGQIRGWLRLDRKGDVLTIDTLLHPDASELASQLVGYAARLASGHTRPVWIVPSFQPAMARALGSRSWTPSNSYAVLVRSAATPVEEPALIPARA